MVNDIKEAPYASNQRYIYNFKFIENQLGKQLIMGIRYLRRLKAQNSRLELPRNTWDTLQRKWYFPTTLK